MKIEKIGVFKDFTDNSIMSVFDLGKNKMIDMLLLDIEEDIDVISVSTHYCYNLEKESCNKEKCNCSNKKSMEKIDINEFLECLISSLTKQNSDEKRTSKTKLQIVFDEVDEILVKEVYLKEEYIKAKLRYEKIGYIIATTIANNDIKKLLDIVEEVNIPIKLEFLAKNEFDIKEKLNCLDEYNLNIKKNKNIKASNDKFNKNNSLVEIVYPLYSVDKKEVFDFCSLLKGYDIPIKFLIVNNNKKETLAEECSKLINDISKEYVDLKVKLDKIYGLEVGGNYKSLSKNNFLYNENSNDETTNYKLWKVKHQIYEQHRSDYLSWDEYFMAVAKLTAMRSKDPNTQVGACIVGDDNRILSIGYNGSPNGYCDECFIWERVGGPLDTKYMYVVHAERNAILNYRGSRRDFEGAKIYVDLFPCNECAKEIIQAGIKEVIYLSDKYAKTDSTIASKKLFDACGVKYRQLNEKVYKEIVLNLNIENE